MPIELSEHAFLAGRRKPVSSTPLEPGERRRLLPHIRVGYAEVFPATNARVDVEVLDDRSVAVVRLDRTGNPINRPEILKEHAINQHDISVNHEPGKLQRIKFVEPLE